MKFLHSTLLNSIISLTRSSFILTRVFNLNTQVEGNSFELELNKVKLRSSFDIIKWSGKFKPFIFHFNLCIPFEYTSWRELNWTCWIKKFHAVKFNLNEEISHSEIQLEWKNFIISFRYSTKVIFSYSTVQLYSFQQSWIERWTVETE